MNDIVAINGSPKLRKSASGLLIDQISQIVGAPIPGYQARQLVRRADPSAALADILAARVLLIVFPLYVDALPAPLVAVLNRIERAARRTARASAAGDGTAGPGTPIVYGVVNCGFYEPQHNRLALDILAHFAARAGLRWGYGVGLGGGGLFTSPSQNIAKGATARAYRALEDLSHAMLAGETREQNEFVTPGMPRFLYTVGAHVGWRQQAKKLGTSKTLGARPHARNDN